MSTTLKIATFALLTIATCAVSNSTTISPPEVIDAKLLEDIMADVNGHKVMLYSKTYCPYSKRLKKVLSKYDIDDMKVMELDMDDNMRNLQNTLKTISGRTTVPQLFIGGHFVGGHDESVQLDNKGELKEMLDKAHALTGRNEF